MKIEDRPGWQWATFRYKIVTEVKAYIQGGLTQAEAVARAGSMKHLAPDGSLRVASRASIYRWFLAYHKDGIDGLFAAERQRSVSTALSVEFVDFLKQQKDEDPEASIPDIIRSGLEDEIITEAPDRTTVYYWAKKLNLPMFRRCRSEQTAMRPFSYAHRLQMVLCDGKQFRAGVQRAKRVALFFLDDATRFVLHVVVGFSESASLFLRGIYGVVSKYGHVSNFYLDRGPGFIADDTASVCRDLARA